ncbi:calcium-independent phospholipase A2-gamma [Tribolium castaneum]|uniref:Calcium-independent phospholipase A2-gamma-like Protein n=1 Tax=Tribolium castaneum TaxID=7070 RepID=D6WQY7_TRICA|nr:PREDICTED: calcium-independent phospholipase A2-gamma [Tribolium castaneum]EFA06525.2 Calcium-independent phospholipase A2-gamma-like Protein [Tribolium castaneum]|eukprot:XP_015836664.1 PREDICTED: calcium-independent phospholipase A2-gamma [Tribolium castaneum]
MPINQWKFLIVLKDSLSKLTNDKNLQNVFGKDAFQVIQKIPLDLNNTITKYIGRISNFNRLARYDPETSGTLPTIFASKLAVDIKTGPKWKNKGRVSKCSISSQTQHVIQSLESAENEDALLSRIEAFISHLQQFPEGRNSAIRAGAVRILLRIRQNVPNGSIQGAVREALAILGHSDPVRANGIRILSMDGGGIRGLLILEMLKKLEELTGKHVHELFDLICGVSTGAILAFILGIHRKHVDEVATGYKDISLEVFKQSPLWGTSNLVWSQAYYDTSLWEKKLREHLGSDSLIRTARDRDCPKLCAISAVVNQSRLSAYVFRNYSLPWRVKSQYFGGSHHEVWQAARASAAAPTYFEEFKLGSFLHQDGGILVNNPTAVALHEAKLIWPETPVQCVVSFGTGRTVPSPADFQKECDDKTSSTSWASKFYRILDSATDTEGVHIMLSDLLPPNVYYRFNPYLTEMISMVEINPQKLEQLQRDAIMYLRRNEDKFQEAAKVLMEEKTYLQKCKDMVHFKRELYGF